MKTVRDVKIDGWNLTLEEVWAVMEDRVGAIALSDEAVKNMERSRDVVASIIGEDEAHYGITTAEKLGRAKMVVERYDEGGRIAYGITTGFGDLANVRIDVDKAVDLQYNLIRSHASGLGEAMSQDIVKGAMLIRANTLCKGLSGVRVDVVRQILEMLASGIVPLIPQKGSVGASGDLAPSAHMALAMIGEGSVFYKGQIMHASKAMDEADLSPLDLRPKEGLAIINGTQFISAYAAKALRIGEGAIKHGLISGAMALEGLYGTDKSLDPRIHRARPHPGQLRVATILRRLVRRSGIIRSHRNCSRVQDAYSIRCMPQVYGPVIEAWNYSRGVLEREINSAVDNPLVFEDGSVLSGGNFHGAPLSMAMDYLAIALANLGAITERRIARLIDPHLSSLPPFLSENSGLNSGYMLAQYTAAALVNENKTLCHPASVDTIPTSANQEDHVSMGLWAARKAVEVAKNTYNVVAIELLLSAQAIDFHSPHKPGTGTRVAHSVIREKVPHLKVDRVVHDDIMTVLELMDSGAILNAVEGSVGPIDIILKRLY